MYNALHNALYNALQRSMARTRAVMLVRAGGGSWGLGYILHRRMLMIMLALDTFATTPR